MQKRAKPIVKESLLRLDGTETGKSIALQVGSLSWHKWLAGADNRVFIFQGVAGHFTARREIRRGSPYWYAYRRRNGKLRKLYLGKPAQVTQERLDQTSARLAGQAMLAQLLTSSNSADMATTQTTLKEASKSFLSLTKVTPPRLPQKLIMRPHLTKRISKPVTIICAPSGFGKSTLLNEWQQNCEMPIAWVSLDANDNTFLRFWFAVVTALQEVRPHLGQRVLASLNDPHLSGFSADIIGLVNEIVGITNKQGSGERIGLVLDDYHHINGLKIHASVQSFLEHLPSNLQIIISSHVKPPLAFGRLRATGMLTELETDHLRFTPEEGIDFLVKHDLERPLTYSDMQTLVKRTEGWVTGLTLATLALIKEGKQDQSTATFTGAHVYLQEYFMENVLSQQPPAKQAFLLKTSILKYLTGPLCDVVTGQADGDKVLSQLWAENLFVERLREQNGYRYHDLFVEMLYSQLQLQYPAEISNLHRRAAEWYSAHDAPTDAVYHLLLIEAWEEAASLIESIALHELEQFGEDSRLLRWLRQLPEAVVQQHNTLLSVYVRLARVALPQTNVEQFMIRAEGRIKGKLPAERSSNENDVLDEIQRIRHVWSSGETVAVQPHFTTREHKDVWQMLNGIMRYTQFSGDELDQTEVEAQEVYKIARSKRHLFAMLMAGGECAHIATWRGSLRQGEEIAHQVLQQAIDQRGKLPETASIALVVLSRICYERNQLEQAHQLLVRASEVDPNPASTNIRVTIAIGHALVQSAQGRHDVSQSTIEAALELNTKNPSGRWSDQDLSAYQALILLRQGGLSGAERLLNESLRLGTHSLSDLVRVEMLLVQEQNAAAERLLNRFIVQYPDGFRGASILSAHVMLAGALLKQRKVRQACKVMEDAVRRAHPETLMRPFLDHGQLSLPVLMLLMRADNLAAGARTFLKKIVGVIEGVTREHTDIPEQEFAALTIAMSISVREKEVLQSLYTGMSNKELAATLSIAECTVKTHLTNIYRKLGVKNRVQAVSRAKKLMLV